MWRRSCRLYTYNAVYKQGRSGKGDKTFGGESIMGCPVRLLPSCSCLFGYQGELWGNSLHFIVSNASMSYPTKGDPTHRGCSCAVRWCNCLQPTQEYDAGTTTVDVGIIGVGGLVYMGSLPSSSMDAGGCMWNKWCHYVYVIVFISPTYCLSQRILSRILALLTSLLAL